ncbi:restriction endonuclease subunit S [Pantanalinema rosaneae CENA516]|uniref:restriction endonuclease subunit S n=1 Tax=Pantanalinema rosaneae TaxID=1620701 RepID=UPI003D6EBB63
MKRPVSAIPVSFKTLATASLSGLLCTTKELAAGGAQPNLNVGKIKETLIPLPPLAEQKRIVAKVDALLSLCDTLEAKLKAVRDSSTTLMEVAAKQILVA